MIAVRLSQGCGSAQIKPDKCRGQSPTGCGGVGTNLSWIVLPTETTSASSGSRPFSLAAALSDSENL
eukprot:5899360-Prymnesium_polylepis.2